MKCFCKANYEKKKFRDQKPMTALTIRRKEKGKNAYPLFSNVVGVQQRNGGELEPTKHKPIELVPKTKYGWG